ncbi:hypothetical protein U7230_07045 [Carboxydochorda subterranea]|uniref:Uncharacterized protein n=1 Tax=Carboxydichorda subterranea TaxID=3109565 RepID=A0ABZ1C3P5_9FIRM|nr:hypothetical protein [Limnochorda sp. L945t]WRP18742.1 hypothetical protein U7230_07045 [Limnochorda sp. L945t]
MNLASTREQEGWVIVIRPVTVLTQFIQEMSVAVDHGLSYPVAEVKQHIVDRSLIPWLKTEVQGEGSVDLSLFDAEETEFLHEGYVSMLAARAGEERRKWGIENNGLCLLISWATELIRGLPEFASPQHRR